jgi:uncharacterized protein YjiS (DUF1127 family)
VNVSLRPRLIVLSVRDLLQPLRTCWSGSTRALLAWRRHREIAVLLGTDDHMLADLGINRADLHSALAVPLWEDPSLDLARRAKDSRQGRRASAGERKRLAARFAQR